jgi:hypothetical protein
MSHRYYTLLSREMDAPGTGQLRWTIEFGDYSKGIVQSEFENFLDHGFRRKDLRIITTGDDQASIEAAVADLNR